CPDLDSVTARTIQQGRIKGYALTRCFEGAVVVEVPGIDEAVAVRVGAAGADCDRAAFRSRIRSTGSHGWGRVGDKPNHDGVVVRSAIGVYFVERILCGGF